jgi:hypothetical protein
VQFSSEHPAFDSAPTEQARRLAAWMLSVVTQECAGEQLIDCVDAALFVAAHMVNFAAIERGADVAAAFIDASKYFSHLAERERSDA